MILQKLDEAIRKNDPAKIAEALNDDETRKALGLRDHVFLKEMLGWVMFEKLLMADGTLADIDKAIEVLSEEYGPKTAMELLKDMALRGVTGGLRMLEKAKNIDMQELLDTLREEGASAFDRLKEKGWSDAKVFKAMGFCKNWQQMRNKCEKRYEEKKKHEENALLQKYEEWF